MAGSDNKNKGWRRLFAPLLGGISAFDLGTMTLLAGLFYHFWGEGLGDDLAEQFGVEPPTSKAFETAAGSFAALMAVLGWITLKNISLNIWHTELGKPTWSSVLSVMGVAIKTGVANGTSLIAFPALVAMLGQRAMEQDNDDELAADIDKLTHTQQGVLFLEVLATVYTVDNASTSTARAAFLRQGEESKPLLSKPPGQTVGGWLWSGASASAAYVSNRLCGCVPRGNVN